MPRLFSRTAILVSEDLNHLDRVRAAIPVGRPPVAAVLVKRSLDMMIAVIIGLLSAPLMLFIAAAIKLTSSGPILFCHYRVGKGGRPFKFFKFRSMVVDAERLKADLMHHNEKDGPIFKMRCDPRVTPIGRWLRRYSLDELPQLYNVLIGDMSLVGPRPPVPSEVMQYQPWHLRRLSVTPGLTCIWQTSGRSQVSFDEWMQMDMHYIDNWNLALDLKLLCKTVKAVLLAEGSY